MIQWNADLARRLQCREEEKKALGPIIQRLMDLDRKARDEGFLSLESELASIDDPLLAVGVRLVMEGVSGEALEEILATYILVEERSGWPFLKACVTIEGLLALAESDEPALMARKLLPYFGADKALAALEEIESAQAKGNTADRRHCAGDARPAGLSKSRAGRRRPSSNSRRESPSWPSRPAARARSWPARPPSSGARRSRRDSSW